MGKVIGDEVIDANDMKTGTGLVGRVARLENRSKAQDRWINRAIGLWFGITGGAAAIWYLIQDKLEKVIK